MILFNVTSDRLYQEWRKHIQARDNAHADWYVDDNGTLHVYIMTDYSYGYHYSVSQSDIPDKIKGIITKNGEILGIYKPNDNSEKVESLLSNMRDNLLRGFKDHGA